MIMKSFSLYQSVKISFFILGMLIPGFSAAQVISGKITDEKTGEALAFANFY